MEREGGWVSIYSIGEDKWRLMGFFPQSFVGVERVNSGDAGKKIHGLTGPLTIYDPSLSMFKPARPTGGERDCFLSLQLAWET